jgi:hypothetical protein
MNQPIPFPQVNPSTVTVVPTATPPAHVNPAPTPCAQVWSLLTPEQQQAVRQTFVQVCRHLTGLAAVESRVRQGEEGRHESA